MALTIVSFNGIVSLLYYTTLLSILAYFNKVVISHSILSNCFEYKNLKSYKWNIYSSLVALNPYSISNKNISSNSHINFMYVNINLSHASYLPTFNESSIAS